MLDNINDMTDPNGPGYAAKRKDIDKLRDAIIGAVREGQLREVGVLLQAVATSNLPANTQALMRDNLQAGTAMSAKSLATAGSVIEARRVLDQVRAVVVAPVNAPVNN